MRCPRQSKQRRHEGPHREIRQLQSRRRWVSQALIYPLIPSFLGSIQIAARENGNKNQ
jgi:hypothetical protein